MSDSLLVSTKKGLFRIQRNSGGRWSLGSTWFLGDPISMVLAKPGGTIVAAADLGHFGTKMHRSTDGGKSWSESAAPAYPPKPEDADDKDPMRGIDVPWTTKLVWSLESGGEDGELWLGTIPGGLFHSTDDGESWSLVRSLWDEPRRKQWMGGGYDFAGIHSIVVDPNDPKHVTIDLDADRSGPSQRLHAARPGRRPAGSGLTSHQALRRASRAPVDAASQRHLRLRRCGRELARARQCAGLGVRLCRGRTFDVLDHGLPDEPAYDLVYRHGLDIAADGECLAFGSTTGSLWVSQNQGDSWQCVSRHLPPILCVTT